MNREDKQWVRRIVTGNQRRIHCLVKSLNLAKTSQSLEKMGEGAGEFDSQVP